MKCNKLFFFFSDSVLLHFEVEYLILLQSLMLEYFF